ncbi:MAG: glycerophosphodiester phosphodiesterase family protein [Planctomycetota bacterium]|nr:glycerophosphodiester phosphodiesterase family protein [Planctomycetota bacterium]
MDLARRINIIAHRGASNLAPENTLAAVRRGWDEGADAVEVDCQLTADGQLVAIHDLDTRRTSGVNWRVAERTLAELRSLDVGRWKGPQWAGEQIPTLTEVIETIPPGRHLFIEVKAGTDVVSPLCQTLDDSSVPRQQLVVIARDALLLDLVKRRLPDVKMLLVAHFTLDSVAQAWTPSWPEFIQFAQRAGLDGLNVRADSPIDEAVAELLANDGLAFYVWTVDCERRARELIDFGVDGIATNRPAWLRERLGMMA